MMEDATEEMSTNHHLTTNNNNQLPQDNVDVQKLKDLVKRLEKQNEHLRNRTGKLGGNTSKHSKTAKTYQENFNDDIIEEVDLNKTFEDTNDDDETSWLYESPLRTKPDKYDSFSVDEWMREELDNPSKPEYVSAKRTIISKLERTFPDLNFNEESLDEDMIEMMDDDDEVDYEDDTGDEIGSEINMMSRSTTDHQEHTMSSSMRNSPAASNTLPQMSKHHLPIPSQTMTSVYGLINASSEFERSPSARSMTPPVNRNDSPNSTGSLGRSSLVTRKSTTPINNKYHQLTNNHDISSNHRAKIKSPIGSSTPASRSLRQKPLLRATVTSNNMTSRLGRQPPSGSNGKKKTSPPPRSSSIASSNGGSDNLTFQRSSTFTLPNQDDRDNDTSSPTCNVNNQKPRPHSSMMTSYSPTPSSGGGRSLPRPTSKLRYSNASPSMTSSNNTTGRRANQRSALVRPTRHSDVTTTPPRHQQQQPQQMQDIWADEEVF